ncbi:hypothetical protein [Chryseobacterium gambrini]|uniref:hypothetical protein n=1 Tax=Chryseobacterium gambrini TaxID=373672 RepID=UPI0022F16681|nr:hypothetical protein [Chryseobacterium gambrini]WBV53530.1 hypothetical protein PFY09_04245 [Chryseobacterium gambrini]
MKTILTNRISFGIGESFSTIFLILFLLSICVFIYRVSKNKQNEKYKFTLVSLSLLLTLHLIIFPFIYTLMLKNNPASFEFKTTIHTNQKKIVLNEWINDSRSLPHEIKDLEEIELSNYSILKMQIKELKRLTFTRDYVIHSDVNFNIRRDFVGTIYIFNKEGVLKNKLDTFGSREEIDSTKFESVLNNNINYLKNELQYYKVKKAELDRNNFWTFATVLPYSISSIFTGNMSPITPIANIFYSFHYFIIYCIGIGVFLHFLILNINFLIRNRKS